MAKHNETGLKGEQIAENFLLDKRYSILHRNWRFERKEIDIIATNGDMLVFVEVKTRKTVDFGFPEEFVTHRKQGLMKQAAEAFLLEYTGYMNVRFDIISILMDKGVVNEIVHYEDAFY